MYYSKYTTHLHKNTKYPFLCLNKPKEEICVQREIFDWSVLPSGKQG